MATVRLDGAQIADWPSFHLACQDAFGFPGYYGRTIDAWVDSLSYLRDEDNMTRFRLKPDEMLRIEVEHAQQLQAKAPELLEEIAFCVEGINERYADYGEKPALELVFL